MENRCFDTCISISLGLYIFSLLSQILNALLLHNGFIAFARHCVKNFRIRSFSGPYFLTFGLNTERYLVSVRMRENLDQKNSEYGHFSRSAEY